MLSTRAVDRRTRIGKALQAWRSDMITDLGGIEELSAAKRALVDAAVKTKPILDSIEAWMFSQPSLVSGNRRGVLPVVLHRNQLVATLKGLLESLGLERRTKPISTLSDIVAEYAANEKLAAESKINGVEEQPAANLSHAKDKTEVEAPEPEQ